MRTGTPLGASATATRPVRTSTYRQANGSAPLDVRDLAPPAQPVSAGLARQGREEDPPTLSETVEAAELWLRYAGTLTKSGAPDYLGWGSDHTLWVALMWALHTHVRASCSDAQHIKDGGHDPDAPGEVLLPATPRLGLFAIPAEGSEVGEGSGKTYLARVLAALCAVPTLETEPTGPALARIMGLMHATLFLDEGAGYFSDGAQHNMSKAILENGYSKAGPAAMSGSTKRVWGNKLYSVGNFGPVALVTVATPSLMGNTRLRPLLSRFIKLYFRQAPEGYRPPRIRPAVWQGIDVYARHLSNLLMEAAPTLASATFITPDFLSPRKAEIWEPMFVMAAWVDKDLMERGYEPIWTKRILAACDWIENSGEEKEQIKKEIADARKMILELKQEAE